MYKVHLVAKSFIAPLVSPVVIYAFIASLSFISNMGNVVVTFSGARLTPSKDDIPFPLGYIFILYVTFDMSSCVPSSFFLYVSNAY